MTVAEVALVAAVSTDDAGIVFRDIRAAASSPDVHPALGTGRSLEIGWPRPFVLDVQPVVLRCRFGPDSVSLPELADTSEAVAHRLSDGDVVGVATTVVPAVGRPELTELRATMHPVPVDADDVGRWLVSECRSGQLSNGVELLGRTPAEDVDAPPSPVGWVGELVGQTVGISS